MDPLLIGVDGSEDSRTALRWAASLADDRRLPLRAMWAWHYPSDTVLRVGRIDLPDADHTDELIGQQLAHLLADVLGDAASDVEPAVGRGPAAAALLRAAQDGARMVVVGSRGLGGFKGLLLGSVSRQLCEHAPCPVTVVRHAEPDAPVRLRTIVVGTDGSEHAAAAMRCAAELAAESGAELVVANAAGPGDVVHPRDVDPHVDLGVRRTMVEGWCAPIRELGVEHHIAVVEGDARTALLDVASDRKADLLVVGSRGHGRVTRLLLGSVATSVVQHSELPVTVVPHGR
jgi:nucleotide-binding universal stress UspA family protein